MCLTPFAGNFQPRGQAARKVHQIYASKTHAELAALLANRGINGDIELPAGEKECATLLSELKARLVAAEKHFAELAASRAGNEKLREEVAGLLAHWFVHGKPAAERKY